MKPSESMTRRWVGGFVIVAVAMLSAAVWYLRPRPPSSFVVTVRDNATNTPVPGIPVYLWDGSEQEFPGNVLVRLKKTRWPVPTDSDGCVTLDRIPGANPNNRWRYAVSVALPPKWQLIGTDGDWTVEDNVVIRIARPAPQTTPVQK